MGMEKGQQELLELRGLGLKNESSTNFKNFFKQFMRGTLSESL